MTPTYFRPTNDPFTIFYVDQERKKLVSFDITSLLTPEEKKQYQSAGQMAGPAKARLQQQYGINFDSLEQQNYGDLVQRYAKEWGYPSYNLVGEGANNPQTFFSGGISGPGSEAEFAASGQVTPEQNQRPQPMTLTLDRALAPGMSGDDVTQLQQWLISQGHSIPDGATGFYGDQTKAAVEAWQKQNKVPVPDPSQYGFFGPISQQWIKSQAPAPGTSTAGGGGTSTGGGMAGGGGTSPGGAGVVTQQDQALQALLNDPNIADDQKEAIRALYGLIVEHDEASAQRFSAAMKVASAFSSPYFKAQIRMVNDALDRALKAKDGDLAFEETQRRTALEDLRNDIEGAKGHLSFQEEQELEDLARQEERSLENIQENLAAVGFTSSSRRTKEEAFLKESVGDLRESKIRSFSEQQKALDKQLARGDRDIAAEIARLRDVTGQQKTDIYRQAEGQLGSSNLPQADGLKPLGEVGGQIPRQQFLDQTSFASSFVF